MPFSESQSSFVHNRGSKEGRKSETPTVSGLKRWTRTRSKRGTRDLIDLNVAWAAEAYFLLLSKKVRD